MLQGPSPDSGSSPSATHQKHSSTQASPSSHRGNSSDKQPGGKSSGASPQHSAHNSGSSSSGRCSSPVAQNSSRPSSSSNDGDVSKEEAQKTLNRLSRLNSIQQGDLETKKSGQEIDRDCIRSWDKDGDGTDCTSRRGVANQVQLSVYPDCIGDNLADLNAFLKDKVDGAMGSIHLLPMYPSTGDRGFAPITYQQVDPEFGSWDDVKKLGSQYQLCLEFMANHISPESEQFKDFVKHGEGSRYRDMFVRWEDIWPEGKPSAEQLAHIRTRKAAPPVMEVALADGSKVPLWNTFKDQQIDIDPFSEEGWKFVEESLISLCKNGGAKLIRLDAFGYVTKAAGTGCFMEEPQVWDLLQRIRDVVKPFGVEVLGEVHEDFNLNIELAKHGYWVYDFALPMLLLHALKFRTAESLKHWLSICPRRQITTLDTHDGMGVDDVAGLAPLVDVREVEQSILSLGGTVNYKHFYDPDGMDDSDDDDDPGDKDGRPKERAESSREALEAVKDYLQPDCQKGCYMSVQHQYNATYFSACKEDPKLYLMARAVQFFTPGVPMVYYVGLLAGRNDYKGLEEGSIRDINRHVYSVKEAESAIKRPVVQALLKLCRFRNYHPAFKGNVFVDNSTPPHLLRVCWYLGTKHLAVLRADFKERRFSISHTPYKTPLAADEVAEEVELGSEFDLDMSEVFELDAVEVVERAEARMQMDDDVAGLGVVDPVELVAMHRAKQQADAANGSSNSTSTSNDKGSSSGRAGSGKAAAAPAGSTARFEVGEVDSLGRYDPETDRFVGGSAGVGTHGYETTGEEQLAIKRNGVKEGCMINDSPEWGLLQLDLSFGWKMEDKPIDNVEHMLQETSAHTMGQ